MSFVKLATSALALSALAGTAAVARDQVQVAGSSTVLPYASIVAEAFGENTDFPTPVVESGGSSSGLKRFCEGVGENTIDVANASRKIREKEIKACAEAGVTFEADFPADPVRLSADADQLRQVFTNLIENAIKYGGGGGRVTVRMSVTAREPALRAPAVRVAVIDYGRGIDPVHLPRLTERFYRADDHRSRALGGTGLGLAIVKHIVNRHRGHLRVQSAPGQGATFTVILPLPGPS